MSGRLKIEFLFEPECPAYRRAWQFLCEEIDIADLSVVLERTEVPSPDQVQEHRFTGSPTIRINGVDLEGPDIEKEMGYGWRCRTYQRYEPGEVRGVPARELIRDRLLEAQPAV